MSDTFLPNGGTYFSVQGYSTGKEQPTIIKEASTNTEQNNIDGYANWGTSNLWPTETRKKLEKADIAPATIYKMVALLYGNGLVYGEADYDADFNRIIKPRIETEIEAFIKKNKLMTRYLVPRIVDYKFFVNIYSEFILSNDKRKINRLVHKESEFSRLAEQSEKTLSIDAMGYCSDWSAPDNDDIANIPLYDPLMDVEDYVSKLNGLKFAHWAFMYSPGKIYYKYPAWGGLTRKDGWIDVSNDTPEIISAMHRNQVKIRYHVKIPYDYWPSKFKDWAKKTEKQQAELIKKELKEMDEFLSDKKNTGKTFTSHYGVNKHTGKPIPGWEIIAIDDKLKQDAYIPNSKAADEKIVQTLGMDTSLMGLSNNVSSLGGGSGSDKRESIRNMTILNTIDQQIILEDLNLVSEYNKWDVEFAFRHTVPNRLDNNASGQEQTTST